MPNQAASSSTEEAPELTLSLVRGDALFRLQRRIGLVPAEGLGVGRRAVFFALLSWAPIAAWAGLADRALPGAVAEPLLRHFGVHVRCLVAIPLFILAEGVGHALTLRLLPFLVSSGLVAESDRPGLREILRGVIRLRDSTLPWVAVAALVLAWTLFPANTAELHEVVWADESGPRPQMGFLEQLCIGWSPVVFGISAVLASRWAHEVVYHGVAVQSLRLPMLAFGVLALVLFLSPLLVWMPRLGAAKRAALLEYSALVGRHGRLVRRRWILREPVDDTELLAAPELGPVADTLTLYQAVRKMRALPVGRQALLAIALPAAIPMLGVVAIEVPVKELLLKVLSTLA